MTRRAIASGVRLQKVVFPNTEIQRYGDVAILYTSYELTVSESGAAPATHKGVATEFFVWRDAAWMHTGWHLAPMP